MAAVAPAAYGFAGAVSAPYQLLIDMAGKISNIAASDDSDGVKVITYTFDAIYDAAWGSGRYLRVQAQNRVTALEGVEWRRRKLIYTRMLSTPARSRQTVTPTTTQPSSYRRCSVATLKSASVRVTTSRR